MSLLKTAFAATLFAATASAVMLRSPALAFDPGATECIAPAAAGGGWDFTCRQVGKAMQDLKLDPRHRCR